MNLKVKKVKIESEVVRVTIVFELRTGLEKRRRFYTNDAIELIASEYPNLEIGKSVKTCTARNYDEDNLVGEWIFKLKKKKSLMKRKVRQNEKVKESKDD